MAAEKIVRITRVCDVVVEAEYGDTDETLLAKASFSDDFTEQRNLVHETVVADLIVEDDGKVS